MKIAIVGSRKYQDLEKVIDYVKNLPEGTVIVSGGASGVDTVAENAARARGLGVISIKPDWKTYGKAAGPIRNQEIVNQSDKLIAFWDGESRGTQSSIRFAQKKGIEVEIWT